MNKIFVLAIFASILMLGVVSAGSPICATAETTFVSGTITDQTKGNAPVDGATVMVNCNGFNKTTTSNSNGSYSVEYLASECSNNADLSVSATKNSLTGNNGDIEWTTENTIIGCLNLIVNVGCTDVPLIPEFGLILGGITIAGALVAFFIIRRK